MTTYYTKKGDRYALVTDPLLTEANAWGSDGLMALAAFRYCLGRMTYIVGDCERWLFTNWDQFPPNVRKLIQREVEEEIKRDDEARERGEEYKPLGHDCDRAAWERVRGLWITEEHRRTTP